jgi:glycosyltransferase involved in cell wall biosynthesis
MRVLHLATWYPSASSPYAVPFIKAHYEALGGLVEQRLIHVEVAGETEFCFEWKFGEDDSSRAVVRGFRGPTRLRELLTLVLLALVRLRLGKKDWDVVLIHVAWPTHRFPFWVRLLFGNKVVLLEHWSAYAENFYLNPKSRAHARMRRMFERDTPLIVVSDSLAKDIKAFAQRDDLNIYVVPNVVGARFSLGRPSDPPIVFLAANWNSFRLPFLVLEAMSDILDQHPQVCLVIAGGGPKLPEMREYVSAKAWGKRVSFLGQVDRNRIAEEMRRATVFAHPAKGETFSVITAEALSCGVPAVVSNVGALPELVVHGENGFLVENDVTSWREALLQALDPKTTWDRKKISDQARSHFSPEVVGRQLLDILEEVAAR